MKSAGVVLVPFNASLVVEYHDKYIGDSTFYTMELGRELSRCNIFNPSHSVSIYIIANTELAYQSQALWISVYFHDSANERSNLMTTTCVLIVQIWIKSSWVPEPDIDAAGAHANHMCCHRYMWRHNYNTSFYQVAQQMASPVTKSTVLSTIINRNSSTFPSIQDYFDILSKCETSKPCVPWCLKLSTDYSTDINLSFLALYS